MTDERDETLDESDAFAPPLIAPAVRAKLVLSAMSGLGAFVAVYLLAELSEHLHTALLIAPFGASCVLAFAAPHSPLAQPRNVLVGHTLGVIAGLLVLALIGAHPAGYAVGVALAIAAMQLTDTLHPPAGANPIVVLMTGATWKFLFVPALAGAAIIVAVAWLFHRLVSKHAYPHR